MRGGLVTMLILIAACIVPEYGHASLNDQYPTDADGNVEVPALSALSSAIVGSPMHTECAPSDPDYYGWTFLTETSEDDGATWTILTEPYIYISGDICTELARLADYSANKRFFKRPKIVPRSKAGEPQIVWVGDNEHIYNAGAALLTLVHESLHVKLASDDEGLVECTAIRNVWPTLAALHLPLWLNKELLAVMTDVHLQSTDDYRTVC
jgi:hypothetical protein